MQERSPIVLKPLDEGSGRIRLSYVPREAGENPFIYNWKFMKYLTGNSKAHAPFPDNRGKVVDKRATSKPFHYLRGGVFYKDSFVLIGDFGEEGEYGFEFIGNSPEEVDEASEVFMKSVGTPENYKEV